MLRARLVEALGSADVIAAEDTRRVRTLAQALGVKPAGRVVSFFDQNEASRGADPGGRHRGRCDGCWWSAMAGMPLISDPGYRLVAGLC